MFSVPPPFFSPPKSEVALEPIWDAATIASPLQLQNSDTRLYLPTGNSAITKNVRATKALTSGKWYWEIDIVDVINGLSTTTGIGIVESGQSLSVDLGGGTAADSVAWWCSGRVYRNGSFTNIGLGFTDGVRAMFALDIAAGKFWVGANNTWEAGGNPGTGSGATVTGLSTSKTYYPAACPYSSVGETVKLDIKGGAGLLYAIPSGFTSYSA